MPRNLRVDSRPGPRTHVDSNRPSYAHLVVGLDALTSATAEVLSSNGDADVEC